MTDASTIWLRGPYGPGGKDYDQGYIANVDTNGVTLNTRDDWRGESRTYLKEVIARIDHNTGWGVPRR